METKICNKCGEEKDESLFRVQRNGCRSCEKKANRKWRDENKERVREYERRRYKNNPDQKDKNNRKWLEKNKDKMKQWHKECAKKNREKLNERALKWAKINPERAKTNAQKARKVMSDFYVRRLLICSKIIAIQPETIKIKRAILTLKREIHEKEQRFNGKRTNGNLSRADKKSKKP